jgi:nucleoid-associated protein YgaU
VKKPEVKQPVVQKPLTGKQYLIVKGDTLWSIAVKQYGSGYEWTRIWKANKAIKNPHWIYAGNTLSLPGK